MSILEGLNPAQVEAVRASDGPVLVVAGPGSGKTRVLTHRIAYIIGELGVAPYRILAVTFTNKAAREMVSRLDTLIGADVSQLMIGTFHSICARILRREGPRIGVANNFVIYDADDQRSLITRVLKDLDIDSKQYQPSAVHAVISRAKNDLQTPETYVPKTYWQEVVSRVFERYEEAKAESNALDFDDLLVKAEELFRVDDDVRERYRRRLEHVLVDEFQDTNRAQYELMCHLVSERRNIFVVGDEDQSIYSWRGADFRNVQRFRQRFPDARVYFLEQNYRSTRRILDAAQAIISRNAQRTHKVLWTDNEEGEPVHIYEAYDEREEADYVAGHIHRLVARGECTYGECSVMYRTNAQSRALEDAFLRYHIPYRLVGAVRFYQRREVKDVLAYLRVIYNPDDAESLRRIINVPRRGIGDRTLEELAAWSQRQGLSVGRGLLRLGELAKDGEEVDRLPFAGRARNALLDAGTLFATLTARRDRATLSELLRFLLEETHYLEGLRDGSDQGEERASNVRELFTATQRYDGLPPERALPTFLEEVALYADADDLIEEANAVTLLTLHTAKGLEFDTVFIVGLEEGICPHSRSMDEPEAMEEERRLCYVGVTRARRKLFLLRAFRRTLYGTTEVRDPSRFLLDIPQELVDGNLARPGAVRAVQSLGNVGQTRPQGLVDRENGRHLFARRRSVVQRILARQKEMRSLKEDQRGRHPATTQSAQNTRGEPADAEPTFRPGEAVAHPTFGKGTVISTKIRHGDEEVTVAFEGLGLKRLMLSYARLTRVD